MPRTPVARGRAERPKQIKKAKAVTPKRRVFWHQRKTKAAERRPAAMRLRGVEAAGAQPSPSPFQVARMHRRHLKLYSRSRQVALKVHPSWLRKMMHGGKRHEIRTYLPKRELQNRGLTLKAGDRMFLLGPGEVWGSAKFLGIKQYLNRRSFTADEAKHCVGKDDETQRVSYSGVLKRIPSLYAWKLSDFRWHPERRRPESGGRWRVAGRKIIVPSFSGQEFGQIFFWDAAKRTGNLPSLLEPVC